jgi:hypothetical protein
MSSLEQNQNSLLEQLLGQRFPIQVNLNTTARSNANLALIDVPAPANQAETAALVRDTVTVSGFLKRKFSGLDLNSAEQRMARTSYMAAFGYVAKLRKLQSGDLNFAGQINRAQVHYRLSDLPLLEGVWEETQALRDYFIEANRNRLASA